MLSNESLTVIYFDEIIISVVHTLAWTFLSLYCIWTGAYMSEYVRILYLEICLISIFLKLIFPLTISEHKQVRKKF